MFLTVIQGMDSTMPTNNAYHSKIQGAVTKNFAIGKRCKGRRRIAVLKCYINLEFAGFSSVCKIPTPGSEA
jgi:hypothetical protein